MWQSFQSLPIYIFERHKIINSSVMYKIFFAKLSNNLVLY